MNLILKGLPFVLAGIPLQAALPPHRRLLFNASRIRAVESPGGKTRMDGTMEGVPQRLRSHTGAES